MNVGSADIIATLISLKKEVEAKAGNTIKLTIAGGTEAHLLAPELAAANVGVIVTPTRSYVRVSLICVCAPNIDRHAQHSLTPGTRDAC